MPLDQRIEKPERLVELLLGGYLMDTICDLVGCFVKHKEGEVIWLI
tara:strand:+ start:1003 stop:1140 length:138 start_codon:yes stop_codon:yes gene_type:complete